MRDGERSWESLTLGGGFGAAGLALILWGLASGSLGLALALGGGGLTLAAFGAYAWLSSSEGTLVRFDPTTRTVELSDLHGEVARLPYDAISALEVFETEITETDPQTGQLAVRARFGLRLRKRDGGEVTIRDDFDSQVEANIERRRLEDSMQSHGPGAGSAEVALSPQIRFEADGPRRLWSWSTAPRLRDPLLPLGITAGMALLMAGLYALGHAGQAILIPEAIAAATFFAASAHFLSGLGTGVEVRLDAEALTVTQGRAEPVRLPLAEVRSVTVSSAALIIHHGAPGPQEGWRRLELPLGRLNLVSAHSLDGALSSAIAEATGRDRNEV